MSKDIAKDMTGALTKVDEKVGVFNQQVSELNKSQDNFNPHTVSDSETTAGLHDI